MRWWKNRKKKTKITELPKQYYNITTWDSIGNRKDYDVPQDPSFPESIIQEDACQIARIIRGSSLGENGGPVVLRIEADEAFTVHGDERREHATSFIFTSISNYVGKSPPAVKGCYITYSKGIYYTSNDDVKEYMRITEDEIIRCIINHNYRSLCI